MRTILIAGFVAAFLGSMAFAQGAPETQAQQAAGQEAGSSKIAPGSVIPAQLTRSIDAKKAKAGDEVVAKVTADMKTKSGVVLVPKDTKIVGHVTAAQARSKEQKESQLGIAFDLAVTKDGKEMQVPMSIQAIIGQENNNEGGAGEGNEPSYSTPAGGGGMGGGRTGGGGMAGGGSTRSQSSPAASTAGNVPNDSSRETSGRPEITGQTQGVIGISNLKLAAAPNGASGSVVTSEKNNVKLDSGTFLLLRVNP